MRRDYLSKLTRAARWYLPPAEAAEVLEDYREIVAGRSEEELRREVGAPRETARQLAQPKAYRRWLAVFAALSACVAVPMVMALDDVYWSPLIRPGCTLAFFLGTGLSFVWFRENGMREDRLPRGIAVLLAAILLGMAWVLFWAGLVLTESWTLLDTIAERVIRPCSLHQALAIEILAMGAASILGLVNARSGDYRWRAVYVLGLSGTILTISFYLLLSSMNFDGFTPGWWMPYVIRYAIVTLTGLLGTGVSLC